MISIIEQLMYCFNGLIIQPIEHITACDEETPLMYQTLSFMQALAEN